MAVTRMRFLRGRPCWLSAARGCGKGPNSPVKNRKRLVRPGNARLAPSNAGSRNSRDRPRPSWHCTEVWGPFFRTPKPLLGLVRRQKLGIDPALPAGVLDLDPIPLPACSCELRAPGGSPENGRVCGGGRPDVDAGTLQKDEIRVLRRGGGLGRHGLGRSRGGERSSNIARRNHTGRSGRWLSHSRSRLHLSLG